VGAAAADVVDDLGERRGEFRADHQESFLVGLGRRDLQHRDDFASGR
jgi:hypothetical protein